RAVRSQAAMIQPMERIAREQWAPDGVYLNTASYGLPPKVGWDALQAALADWRGGRTSWEHWGEATERSREAWAAMVGVSAGDVADLDAMAAAAEAHGAITVVDATQACGWLPLDASRFDVVVAGAYKWLMSPRGTAFMALRRDRLRETVPWAAGWYAGADVHASYFGPPLRLADAARRLDTSPAWFSW